MGMPDGYYLCLLTLPDLKNFHSTPNISEFRNIHYMALAKGIPLPPLVAGEAIDDGEAEGGEETEGRELEKTPVVPLAPLALLDIHPVDVPSYERPAMASSRGVEVHERPACFALL